MNDSHSPSPVTGPAAGLAMRYAQALYAYATEKHIVDQTVTEATRLAQAIDGSPELHTALSNPLLTTGSLNSLFATLVKHTGITAELQRFVGVIVQNRRAAAVSQILHAFTSLVAKKQGYVQGKISSAHALTDSQKAQLNQKLGTMGYDPAKLQLRFDVDPSLLGGLVVRIGAYQYDTSLKSRLQRLQLAMKEAA